MTDLHPTGAEASDSKTFENLRTREAEVAPRAVTTDKGYGAKANLDGARERGAIPVIAHRPNATDMTKWFPKRPFKLRARLEILIGKAKRLPRLAMRCGKTART